MSNHYPTTTHPIIEGSEETVISDLPGGAVIDEPGAPERSVYMKNYQLDAPSGSMGLSPLSIVWQDGPIKEAGLNGVQVADVLEAALHRMEFLQSGFASVENHFTISAIKTAIWWQNERTRRREEQGIEGTNLMGPGDDVEGTRWTPPALDHEALFAVIEATMRGVGLQDVVVYNNGVLDFDRTQAIGILVNNATAKVAFPLAPIEDESVSRQLDHEEPS